MDFGVEHAAWLEFDSVDMLSTELSSIFMSISEYLILFVMYFNIYMILFNF